jgi:hypothetical protein
LFSFFLVQIQKASLQVYKNQPERAEGFERQGKYKQVVQCVNSTTQIFKLNAWI